MSSRFLVRQGSQTVIIHVSSGGQGGNAQEPPSPVAVAQCTLIVNLMVCATWLGLWAGYDMAENCDKELRLWYDLVLGGMAFGLACDLRRRAAATGPSSRGRPAATRTKS